MGVVVVHDAMVTTARLLLFGSFCLLNDVFKLQMHPNHPDGFLCSIACLSIKITIKYIRTCTIQAEKDSSFGKLSNTPNQNLASPRAREHIKHASKQQINLHASSTQTLVLNMLQSLKMRILQFNKIFKTFLMLPYVCV